MSYIQLLICSFQATTGGNEYCLVSLPNYPSYRAFLTLMKPGFATHQASPINKLINSTTAVREWVLMLFEINSVVSQWQRWMMCPTDKLSLKPTWLLMNLHRVILHLYLLCIRMLLRWSHSPGLEFILSYVSVHELLSRCCGNNIDATKKMCGIMVLSNFSN